MVSRAIGALYRTLQVLMTVLMALLIVPVVLQVFSRFTSVIPRYIWTEEVARFCFIWIIMLGSMIAVREDPGVWIDRANPCKRGVTAIGRHREIKRGQIRSKRLEAFNCRLTRRRLPSYLVPSRAENPADHDPHKLRVIGDENGRQVASFVGFSCYPTYRRPRARS